MSTLSQALANHAQSRPDAIALQGPADALSYQALADRLEKLRAELASSGIRRLGLLADNSVDWAVADLAALSGGLLLVPLPPFFSPQQLLHAIRNSGLDAILSDQPEQVLTLLGGQGQRSRLQHAGRLELIRLPASASTPALPPHTAKITYTSGTTGNPKGVCLSREAMETVAQSLAQVSQAVPQDRHLCLLPLSTLLENIGGIYVPLLAGATAVIPPLAQVGLRGAAALDIPTMVHALHVNRASSAIMVPQLLHALVAAIAQGAPAPAALRFVAVGGAPVSPSLLAQAQHFGLPIFEGYGLSECASVVAVNAPGARKPGSVGKPLPHVRLKFAADSEIYAGGAVFEGYLGLDEKPDAEGFWATGDTGHLDDEGYLHLTGRKKNMFITSFGRNVAPEWVERELTIQPVIAQAMVYGEARPWNVAIIVPRPLPGVDLAQALPLAIAAANQSLPDYARIGKWLIASAPFTPQNNLLTANGRLRRAEILTQYGQTVDQLYEERI
ncbi:MAG: AMP-binding protein [Nitrosomonadales bacterium]|nr:AMP-binding protein [Nitrosomonadales bacterium]